MIIITRIVIDNDQGSSARLALPAILGKRRAWREVQNLYMRFVVLKVRNPLLCTLSRGHLYFIKPNYFKKQRSSSSFLLT